MNDINAGIYQVLALARKLQNECDSLDHKTDEDDILIQIAKSLFAFASFLAMLMRPTVDMKMLIEAVQFLESADSQLATQAVSFKLYLGTLGSVEEKRTFLIQEACISINLWADVGRKCLRRRELKRAGSSAEEIKKLAEEPPSFIFGSYD